VRQSGGRFCLVVNEGRAEGGVPAVSAAEQELA